MAFAVQHGAPRDGPLGVLEFGEIAASILLAMAFHALDIMPSTWWGRPDPPVTFIGWGSLVILAGPTVSSRRGRPIPSKSMSRQGYIHGRQGTELPLTNDI
jgi:hypothetical protein